MSGIPAFGSPGLKGLLGVLKSWLKGRSTDVRQLSVVLPSDTGAPKGHSYGSVRVLVVDDNPVNLMVIAALMEARGLVPLLAADGAEAVALASELDFDLILMDLQMPILDGLAATSAIRRFETSSSRPAVPVVAYFHTSAGPGLLATYGMNGSLTKPCGDEELEDCLVRWCPTYRSARPRARPTSTELAASDSGCEHTQRVAALTLNKGVHDGIESMRITARAHTDPTARRSGPAAKRC